MAKNSHKIWFLVGWLVVGMACNTLVPGKTLPSAPGETLPPIPTASDQMLVTPDQPTQDINVGLSRAHPVPYGETASARDVSFRVLEVLQGKSAWEELEQANKYNAPAPDGFTWMMIRLWVGNDSNREIPYPASYFMLTGSLGYAYFYEGTVPPEPRLPDTLSPASTAEGWVPYLVQSKDDNLLLFYNPDDREEPITFLALSPNAAVTESNPALVPSSDLGTRPDTPAPAGETVSVHRWTLRVDEALRGTAAWQLVSQANRFNTAPAEGREYLAVRLTVQATHTDERYNAFISSTIDCLDGEVIYKKADVIAPSPRLSAIRLFPGASASGWIVLDVPEGATCTLRYQALFDFYDDQTRYLAIP